MVNGFNNAFSNNNKNTVSGGTGAMIGTGTTSTIGATGTGIGAGTMAMITGTGTMPLTTGYNRNCVQRLIVQSDFNRLQNFSDFNKIIHDMLEVLSIDDCTHEGVLLIAEDLKKFLIQHNLISVYKTITNQRGYKNVFYDIKGVSNALLVQIEPQQQLLSNSIQLYKVIPKKVISVSGSALDVVDAMNGATLHYNPRLAEYGNNKQSIERLMLGLRDRCGDVYNGVSSLELHHDINKAVLTVNSLALGLTSDHKKYHSLHGGCYKRNRALYVNTFDKWRYLITILRLLYL